MNNTEEQFQSSNKTQADLIHEMSDVNKLDNSTKNNEESLTNLIIENTEKEADANVIEGFRTLKYRNGNIYSGDFYGGMMVGRGKYVWLDGVTYEGDMTNNEITGTGFYKWINSNCYEGEVCKGKRHGFGTFKTANGNGEYNGEWFHGKREGKGKILFDKEGKSYYEGDWINDKPFGWGIRRYSSGNFYEGMWINGIRHGVGTMRWMNKNQIYVGQWSNNIQNGSGEHHWYLTRIESSQYVLRNSYYGEFLNGKRHGHGTFLYANGSKYQGYWKNNLKHGFGKITLKNGNSFEIYFEKDKLVKPNYIEDSPSISLHKSVKEIDYEYDENNLKLDFETILSHIAISQHSIEKTQALKTVIRHIDVLRKVYRYYSQLGFQSSPDNTYTLNRMQLWRFIKDCKLHHNNFTLAKIDRLLYENMFNAMNPGKQNEMHSPFDKILMREFLSLLLILSYYLYKDTINELEMTLSQCFEKLVKKIEEHSCNVQGYLYNDAQKTSYALNYMLKCYEAYKLECLKIKAPINDMTIKMRDFLRMLNEYQLINRNTLNTKDVIRVLSYDDPNVQDTQEGYFNLELEMIFLEYFEALIGCAIKYMNLSNINGSGTPRASTIITREQSFLSDASVNTHIDNKEEKLKDEVENQNILNEKESSIRETSSKKTELKNKENENHTADTERDIQVWFQKVDTFFNVHFFPEITKYQNLEKLANLD